MLFKDEENIYCCLDCEATGLNKSEDRIIELAIVTFKLTKDGYEVIETFNSLINPKRSIPQESIDIHHITNDMVTDQPTFDKHVQIIRRLISNHPIVGHSVDFDMHLIQSEYKRVNEYYPYKNNLIIDTLRLARLNGSEIDNSLIKVARKNNINAVQTHRALDDVMLNIEVFCVLSRKFKSFNQMKSAINKPIKLNMLPFGKYKGRPLSAIPERHLHWLSKQEFDIDIGYSINKEIKRRKQHNGFHQKGNPFSGLKLN
ncbi:DUF3820 family protein [Chlamydiia bacterium]|nr:DUF3820 family protein [Chlamydiia bacterium]